MLLMDFELFQGVLGVNLLNLRPSSFAHCIKRWSCHSAGSSRLILSPVITAALSCGDMQRREWTADCNMDGKLDKRTTKLEEALI